VQVDCGDAGCGVDGELQHLFVNGVAEVVGGQHVAKGGVALQGDICEAGGVMAAADADEDGNVRRIVVDGGEQVEEGCGDEVRGWLFVPLGLGATDFDEEGWGGQVRAVVCDFVADLVWEFGLLDAGVNEAEESGHGVGCGGDEGVGSSAEGGVRVIAYRVDGEGGCTGFATVSGEEDEKAGGEVQGLLEFILKVFVADFFVRDGHQDAVAEVRGMVDGGGEDAAFFIPVVCGEEALFDVGAGRVFTGGDEQDGHGRRRLSGGVFF